MKKYQQLGAVLVMGLGFSAAANSAVLYDTLSANISGEQGIPPGWIATKFSTESNCPNGCTLGDITLKMSGSIDGAIQGVVLQIFNDAGSIPGISAVSNAFQNPGVVTSTPDDNVFKFGDSNKSIVLSNNTSYWVRLDASAPGAANVNWAYGPGTGRWAFDTLLGDFAKGSGADSPFLMRVEASPLGVTAPAHVPVPAAAWMMLTGIIGLVPSWRRKK